MNPQSGIPPVRTEGAGGQHDWCDGMIARATEKIGDLRAQLAERDAAAAEAAGSAALLAFADRLDRVWAVTCAATASERLRANVIEPTLKDAAEMARRAAESHRTDAESATPVSRDAGSVLSDSGAADDCMEAGPS